MKEVLVLKLVFGSFLTIGGVILLLLAFKLFYKYLIQETRCTVKTKGIIKKYTLGTRGGEHSGIHLPIVYYKVNDKEYKVIGPEYKSYTVKTAESPMTLENQSSFEEKDGQKLIITHQVNSSIGVFKNPMLELYPINSEIDVYYDPKNPKLAYVLRYCNRKIWFWLMLFSGIIILLIDCSILMFI